LALTDLFARRILQLSTGWLLAASDVLMKTTFLSPDHRMAG